MRKRLASSIRCAIINRSKIADRKKAARLLQKDILNCALHCFGSHHNCSADYCKVVKNLESANNEASLSSLPISIPHFGLTVGSVDQDSSISVAQNSSDFDTLFATDCQSTSDLLTTSDCLSTSESLCTSDCVSTSDCMSTSTTSDDTFNSDSPTGDSVDDEGIERNALEEILVEQQIAWKDATDDTQMDPLEPSHPIDNQMICDINSIASRLVSKAEQLLGKSLALT